MNKAHEVALKIINEIEKHKIHKEQEYFQFHQHRFEHMFWLLDTYQKDKVLLDIGAHYLHNLLGAHHLGFTNISWSDLDIFNSISVERAKNIGATIKTCNLETEVLPFEDSSFDIVVFTEILEHFNFHPKRVFEQISRVLKKDGEIIVTTPNLLRLNNRLKMFLGRSINYDISKEYSHHTHYREYSVEEVTYLFNAVGIKVKWVEYVDFDYPNRSFLQKIVNNFVGIFTPWLKSNIAIIGEKQ